MTNYSSLVTLLDKLRNASVLCIGDVMLDRFVNGRVTRISPEAPIPVLRIEREKALLGGAGNVVRNIAALGGHIRFIACIGNDAAGRDIRRLLKNIKKLTFELISETEQRTSIKTRFLARGQQLLRTDDETSTAISSATHARIIAKAKEWLPDCGAMILSDYGKGVLDHNTTAQLIKIARHAGIPTVVDPKGIDYEKYRDAFLLTPNYKELAQASQLPTNSDKEVTLAAQTLIKTYDVENVLTTRSQNGMSLTSNDHAVIHLPTEAREVFNVSGAGDTVAAVLTLGLAAGVSIADAAALSNVAAGIVVGKIDTAVAHADELIAILRHRNIAHTEAKVLSLDAALDRIAIWRTKGFKIGFTNGCFDLLHPGHVTLLTQTKEICDRLVVGLNTDTSVKRLKGATRPIQTETARATVLAALNQVDLVIPFKEDTPLKLIKALHPDLLVKGSDYKIEEVVGASEVHAYGGKVVLVELEKGHGTTSIIARLNNRKTVK